MQIFVIYKTRNHKLGYKLAVLYVINRLILGLVIIFQFAIFEINIIFIKDGMP